MKLRLILSAILTAVYVMVLNLYRMVESPIVGSANAQQLTDTTTGYAIHKAVSDGQITNVFFYIFVLALVGIWGSLAFAKSNQTN